MAQLDSVARILEAWYRMVGSVPADYGLIELGEAEDEVAYIYLTSGCHDAQMWMLDNGYQGWRKRTAAALSWSGSDATTGGRYATLPSDFLRLDGNRDRSALVEANGDRWGAQLDSVNDTVKGNYFYLVDDELWLARTANPPTVYAKYHYQHPEWASDITIDFPMKARSLIVAYAANSAMNENWFTGGNDERLAITRAVGLAEEKARKVARQGKHSRQWRKQRVYGRW